MQLISITELQRPGWSKGMDENAVNKTTPSATEAISIVEAMVHRGCFDEPPPDYEEVEKNGEKTLPSRPNYTPEEIYRTVRDHQYQRRGHGEDRRRSGVADAYSNNYQRHNNLDGYGHFDDHRRESQHRYDNRAGDGIRERYRERGNDRRGSHFNRGGQRNRRYANGDQFANNFRRHLGTMMRRR